MSLNEIILLFGFNLILFFVINFFLIKKKILIDRVLDKDIHKIIMSIPPSDLEAETNYTTGYKGDLSHANTGDPCVGDAKKCRAEDPVERTDIGGNQSQNRGNVNKTKSGKNTYADCLGLRNSTDVTKFRSFPALFNQLKSLNTIKLKIN